MKNVPRESISVKRWVSSVPFWADLALRQLLFSNKIFNFVQKTHDEFGLTPILPSEDDGMAPLTYHFKHHIILSIGSPDIILRNQSKLVEKPSNVHYSGFIPDKKLYPSLHKGELIDFIEQSDLPVVYSNMDMSEMDETESLIKILTELDELEEISFIFLVSEQRERKLSATRKNFVNIFATSSIPQGSVLLHHKVKAFLTNCDIESVHDSIYATKPMLTFPLFHSQRIIAHRVVQQGMGVRISDLSTNTIMQTIKFVFRDDIYHRVATNLKNSKTRMMSLGGFSEAATIVEKVASGVVRVESVEKQLGISSADLYTAIYVQLFMIHLVFLFAFYVCYKLLRKTFVMKKPKTE